VISARMHVVLVLFLALAFDPSCALTERSKPLEVSFYTPERVRIDAATSRPPVGPPLRLGRVSSGVGLGERIAFRDGKYEVGYYDGRRWTERPEVYVRRAITRTLFEEGGLDRALSESAPTLDVEVLSFEEVKMPTAHAAHIALRVVLSTDRVLLEDTVGASEPIGGGTFEDVVAALARALDGTSNEVMRRVRASLSAATVAPGSP
jgi:cholesterol transport system auxiliary component